MKPALQPGRLLATRYRLIDQIGSGGMSVIWRAHDEILDRVVALKVLAPSLAADARFRDMVREEARAAAQLVHPNVTSVHDYGETVSPDGAITSFVVMELLSGEELEFRLTEGPLPWQQAVEIGAQVADALAAAHRLGIVHRDITTANVMMTQVGAKVLDFGIATRIGAPDDDEDGATFGTPAYVAPERLDGAPAQPATDVYSLGVLLHETLTGRVPYPADTWDELAVALTELPPPSLTGVPGLPVKVAEICLRCLSRDPADRPTARQVATALRNQMLPADPRANAMLAATTTLPTTDRTATVPGPAWVPPTVGSTAAQPDLDGSTFDTAPGTGTVVDPIGRRPDGDGKTGVGVDGAGSVPASGAVPEGRRRRSPLLVAAAVAVLIVVALAVPALLPEEDGGSTAVPPTTEATAMLQPAPPGGTASVPPTAVPSGFPPTPATTTDGPDPGGDSLVAAANRLDEMISAGLADGGIRDDVGLDLRNELRNLTRAVARGEGELGPGVARLREKVSMRLRENGLSTAYAQQLDAAITALGAAQV
ncbi:protein kinase [Micromonospora sp. HNM0581]|uniref:serine/threonine-protein kinase n=1 Tax=Micromonospora sp. HNM0581 TaxID=2716341 RepID=UPI003216BF64